MASVQLDPSSGIYRIRFRFGGKGYFRSLNTKSEAEATSLCGRAESVIRAIDQGFVSIPPGIDPADFILAGGKLTQTRPVIDSPRAITLAELFEAYERGLTLGSKEPNTLETERTHRRKLIAHFGDLPVERLDHRGVQEYVNIRGAAVKTIRLELGTLRMLWNWGYANGHVKIPLPFEMRRLTLPKGKVREPFQTWEQIERKAELLRQAGKLTPAKEGALWECLYLDEGQIKECLEYVKASARHPFVHPMFAFCAYTGARRSEILRSEREDWDFDHATVTIRQKKADTSRAYTLRQVPIHPALAQVMRDWFGAHPGGPYTICTENLKPLVTRMATKHFRATLRASKWAVVPGFHCFRHSLASIMATRGIDQRIINDVLGHSTEDMVRRYRHLFPAKKDESIRSLFT